MRTHQELRHLFAQFYKNHRHVLVPPIPLIPKDDPTTLFTGSGMQQLVPYLLGAAHPLGKKLYNIQPCFRSQDIEEIGDNRHDTFFEMMGNWSLGDYFKYEQLNWYAEFLFDGLKLDPNKIFVTVFSGDPKNKLTQDSETISIWQTIFKKYGIDAKLNERIFPYGVDKNWWSRAGSPDNMPKGEPGGPDSEVFYQFDIPHDVKYGKNCHPNCNCGRFLEIGNSVFMEYKKDEDKKFTPLPNKNVDFGGGLERMMMAWEDQPDLFSTSLFADIIKTIEIITGKNYQDKVNQPAFRIIADHIKASVFLINAGVYPGNKEHGYYLRRLLRRLTLKIRFLAGHLPSTDDIDLLSNKVLSMYTTIYFDKENNSNITKIIVEEIKKFSASLERGLKQIEKIGTINGAVAFDIYQSYGFPLEITEEIFREKGQQIDKRQFLAEFEKHKNLSRTASSGKFKGGLADQNKETIKYHTATHLLHQALYDVLGNTIRQEGSNITGERLRFDFFAQSKPSNEQIIQVEHIINQKIKDSLAVTEKILPKSEAEKLGAKSFFREKYPDMVKVYFIDNYSKEFCGGPHVKNTGEIGAVKIYKLENIGSNLYRIYAK